MVSVAEGGLGFPMVPSMYPVSPLDPSNCAMVIFHFRRFSPLNFCSSESIVREDVPDDMLVVRNVVGKSSNAYCFPESFNERQRGP